MDALSLTYEIGTDPVLEARVKEGTIVVGRMRLFGKQKSDLAFVSSSLFPCDVVLNSSARRGMALHSDVVAVQLLPSTEWQSPVIETSDTYSSPSELEGKATDPSLQSMPSTLPDGRRIVQVIPPETKEEIIENASAEVALARQMGVSSSYDWPSGKRPLGYVVRVLKRHFPRLHIARIADNQVQPGQALQKLFYYRFIPFNPHLPQLAVQGGDIMPVYQKNINTSLFCLAMEKGADGGVVTPPKMTNMFLCKVHSFLGDASTMEVATQAICTSCDISQESFSEEAQACVPTHFEIPSAEEIADMQRRDLRETEFVITIDPSTARDLDDALSIAPRKDGGYHVGVHIADVSYFVLPGTALDEEAQRRGNSTYLIDRVIPMLPSRLSEQYCSLNPGEDKFTFSALFEFNRSGRLISEVETGEKGEWFGQSIIRSRCRLSYEQAQQILDNDDKVVLDVAQAATDMGIPEEAVREKVKKSVKHLFQLASKLRQESLENGRLVIGNNRLAFRLDRNTMNSPPISFFVEHQIQANWLVEEFMLLANQRVAQKIVQFIPNGALLRRHQPPRPQKMSRFRAALTHRGLPTGGSSGRELQRMLDMIKKDHIEDFSTVCEMLKFSLMAAEYVVNDPVQNDIRSHFAVAAPWYTHFTSPIRRYCDLLVHRQLRVALELEQLMEEEAMELPSVPHPSVETKPGVGVFDYTRVVDTNALKTRELFSSMSKLQNLVIRANQCRVNSRTAGDMSLEYALCLYLLALQKAARCRPALPQVLYTSASIVKITGGAFTLYSAEIATNVEVGFKDTSQRFVYQPLSSTETTDMVSGQLDTSKDAQTGQERHIDNKAKAHARKKGGKSNHPPRSGTAGTQPQHHGASVVSLIEARFSWGKHPNTGEEVTEIFELCTEFVVLLNVTTKQGRLTLGMQILPPWEREAARLACPKLPTSLVEE